MPCTVNPEIIAMFLLMQNMRQDKSVALIKICIFIFRCNVLLEHWLESH